MQEEKLHLETFSARLEAAIKKDGRRAAEIAESAGLSPTAISFYRNGKRMPGAVELQGLSRALGVSMESLLSGTPDEPLPQTRQEIVNEPSAPRPGEAELRADLDYWKSRAEAAERRLQLVSRAPEASPQRISTAETIQGVDSEVADTARDGALRASRMLREESLRRGGKTAASTTGSTAAQAGQSAPATGPATGQKAPAQVQSESGKAGSRRPPSRAG